MSDIPDQSSYEQSMPKRLSGKKLKELRERRGIKREELSEMTGISIRSIYFYEMDEDRYNDSRSRLRTPGLDHFLRLINALRPDINQLIELVSLDYLKDPATDCVLKSKGPLDNSTHSDVAHNPLSIFDGMGYCCYYQPYGSYPLSELIVTQRFHFGEGDYLQAFAKARGHVYDCRITCTHQTRHAFFDFLSDGKALEDSVRLVLPYPNGQKSCYYAGIGTATSLSHPNDGGEKSPCFELMAIVSDECVRQIGMRNLNFPVESADNLGESYVKRIGMKVIGNIIASEKWLRLPLIRDEYMVSVQQKSILNRTREFNTRIRKLCTSSSRIDYYLNKRPVD